jgi:integrase
VILLLAYTGMRFGELVGLRAEDVDLEARRIRVRRSIAQVGGKLVEGNPKSAAGRRSIPVPQRPIPILTNRVSGRPPGAPAITSPNGVLLGLESWKRSTRWRVAIVKIDRPNSAQARPSAHLRLRSRDGPAPIFKAMGHASSTVTAYVYADLYDGELDDVASALDALDDTRGDLP